MTGTTMAKVNLIKGVNWNLINVASKNHNGTLADVNVAVLPKKSECSEQAWQALGCLTAMWKAGVRMFKYPKDADRHENAFKSALVSYCRLTGTTPDTTFKNLLISVLNAHYNKKEDSFSTTSELVFKKNCVRITMRMQSGTFGITNEVKGDKVSTAPGKHFNVMDMSDEDAARLLGLDLEIWVAIKKAKKAC